MEPFQNSPKKKTKSTNDTLSDSDYNSDEQSQSIEKVMSNSLTESIMQDYTYTFKSKLKFKIYSNLKEDSDSSLINLDDGKPKQRRKPKRGRKPKNVTISNIESSIQQLQHTKDSSDNIRRKLKTHYIRFVINFLNTLIRLEWNGVQYVQFNTIDYSFTKIISISENKQIFTLQLKDYLRTPISKKFKYSRNYNNKETVDYLIANKPERFANIFNMTLCEFYDTVYLGNPEKIRKLFGIANVNTISMNKKSVLMFFEEYIKKIGEKEPKMAQMTLVIGKELTWLYSKDDGNKSIKFYTLNEGV